jgi:hypothetical protein
VQALKLMAMVAWLGADGMDIIGAVVILSNVGACPAGLCSSAKHKGSSVVVWLLELNPRNQFTVFDNVCETSLSKNHGWSSPGGKVELIAVQAADTLSISPHWSLSLLRDASSSRLERGIGPVLAVRHLVHLGAE